MTEGKCESGLSYAVKRSGNAVAYCALSTRCGTRDEFAWDGGKGSAVGGVLRGGGKVNGNEMMGKFGNGGYHSGTAHFVEHTIFKGTARHNATYINACLDKLGGELNAYTTKEEIVVHATVLKEDLHKAADLLFELVTSPTFPVSEIDTERGVIIDEINSYKDSPSEEIYDLFEEMLFEGHPLANPILGDIGSVSQITSEELSRFVREMFVPENMAFTVVADIDEADLVSDIEKLSGNFFGKTLTEGKRKNKGKILTERKIKNRGNPLNERALYIDKEREYNAFGKMYIPPQVEFDRKPFNVTLTRDNHQVNCVVGGYAPSLYDHSGRIAMVLLSNIIGGPASNSILNSVLRERRGWVYGVECTYTQYADTGIVAISFDCEEENLRKCLAAINRELGKFCEKPISEAKLRAAKKQVLGQIAIGGDNGENQCLSMGKSLMSYGHVFTDNEGRDQIEAVTPADLQYLARKFFSPSRLSTLTFV